MSTKDLLVIVGCEELPTRYVKYTAVNYSGTSFKS